MESAAPSGPVELPATSSQQIAELDSTQVSQPASALSQHSGPVSPLSAADEVPSLSSLAITGGDQHVSGAGPPLYNIDAKFAEPREPVPARAVAREQPEEPSPPKASNHPQRIIVRISVVMDQQLLTPQRSIEQSLSFENPRLRVKVQMRLERPSWQPAKARRPHWLNSF